MAVDKPMEVAADDPTPDQNDGTDLHNTELPPEEQTQYDKHYPWPEVKKDYDMQGWFHQQWNSIDPDLNRSEEMDKMLTDRKADQHYTDQFKKPNHITFSDESQYHTDTDKGGHWDKNPDGSYIFTPSDFNLKQHDPREMREYFDKYEKGNNVILPGSNSERTQVAENTITPQQSIADVGLQTYRESLSRPATPAPAPTETDVFPDRGTIARRGLDTYDRELRRSPADGTFRERGSMNRDWEGFNSVRVSPGRPADMLIDSPRGWSSTNDDGRTPQPKESRIHGRVEFETKTGKEGAVSYRYDPGTKDIYIKWMGGTSEKGANRWNIQPHELGVDKVQSLMKEIVERHPEAETITAYRAGGARVNNPTGGGSREVTRAIPRERLGLVAAPMGNGNLNMTRSGFGAPGQNITDLY